MSYLNGLRMHFAGRFQANVSTVNNDPAHFDNAAFKLDYQKMQGPDMRPPNGWFNPQGDAAWRFLGCTVTAAWLPSGPVGLGDPVLGYIVADSDSRAPAKLVDLDSEQQLVSEIWGLEVRLATADGTTVMRGEFEPAAFMDIWDRASGSRAGDADAGAMYQSVLTSLQWSDACPSPFLKALRAEARDDRLSIKFNVDAFNLDFTSPDFMTGRIVGTIGPASADEPQHLVIGRQFMANSKTPPGNFFAPAGELNFCAGAIDAAAQCIFLDLGNALPTEGANAALTNLGDLTLSARDASGGSTVLGTIPALGTGGYAQDPAWYARTAGIAVLPLSSAQLKQAAGAELVISGNPGVSIAEWSSGAFVRADRFVYRLEPNQRADITVYAMQHGQPMPGATIGFVADPSQLQAQAGSGFPYAAPSPPVATPASAVAFNATAVTDRNGRAVLTLNTTDPGTPRNFNNGADFGIDGQVYGIRPGFVDSQHYDGPVNQWNFVSILLWSCFTPGDPVTWTDVHPILQQYANLYPVMNRFLDLGDFDDVVASTELLRLAFGLDERNPNVMPVTRDLSPAKRAAILAWLKNPAAGPVAAPTPRAVVAPAVAPEAAAAPPAALQGGKAAAAARRLILQSK
jgi:hypothetical protein